MMFCSKCGNTIADGTKFCARCGSPVSAPQSAPTPAQQQRPVQPVQPVQAQQAAQPVQLAQPVQPVNQAQQVQSVQSQPQTTAQPQVAPQPQTTQRHAAFLPGESFVGLAQGPLAAAAQTIPGTGSVIGGAFTRFFSSIGAALKSPKALIPAIALAVVWLVLNILQAKGINPLPTRALSFLTFAEGGMHGGIIGAIGGIIGKGIVAGALGTLIGLFTRKGSGSSGGGFMGAFGVNGLTLPAWLTGMGTAFILYLFFSGGSMRSAFMCGAAACFLAARAALKRGFVQNLIGSFTSKGKSFAGPEAIGFARGLAVGFAAAALLGFLNSTLLLLIPGAVLIVVGIVLLIIRAAGNKPAKGVLAQ